MAPDDSLPLPLDLRPRHIATKRCRRCGRPKPLDQFYLRPETRRYRADCKDCYLSRRTASRDHEDNRRRVKKWRNEHPEKVREYSQRNHEGRRTDLARWLGGNLRTTRAYCKRKEIPIDIAPSDLVVLFEAQAGRCVLTGRELIVGSKGQQRDSISIDRIEPAKGYVLGNVRLVTYQANMARGQFPDDELFAFCEAVLARRAA